MSPIFHITAFHQLAASRGEGLRQEFLELLHQRAERVDPAVREIYPERQAGPDPAQRIDGTLPKNVLLFPSGDHRKITGTLIAELTGN
ncbi:hypothetical protein [Chelativorans oligotrophicus]|jgi:hypothetical protein|uniref:Uncharacterized protein n=1 Tax=Chelativorans sp. (strain BNC1) TaxID=266779 RepID=Q11IE5_CHESB|nr:hypothetical protein [Chelativorans oligotrophicus]